MRHSLVSTTPPLTGGWERDFPGFTPAQLFDLVSDIEKYPLFIPGCIATRIVQRTDTRWQVDNVFGFGPIRSRFATVAELDEPSRLDISSSDGPWQDFRLSWRFDPIGLGCRVTCRFAVEFGSRIVARLASLGMAEAERLIVKAFEARAHALYGRA